MPIAAVGIRQKHSQRLFQQIEDAGTDPFIRLILTTQIRDHLEFSQPHPPDQYYPHPLPPIYFNPRGITEVIDNAWTCQDFIGWNHLLRGRISENWAIAQDAYLRREKKPLYQDGGKWATKILGYILDFRLRMWTERNTILRGSTAAIARSLTQRGYYCKGSRLVPGEPSLHPATTSTAFISTDIRQTTGKGYTYPKKTG